MCIQSVRGRPNSMTAHVWGTNWSENISAITTMKAAPHPCLAPSTFIMPANTRQDRETVRHQLDFLGSGYEARAGKLTDQSKFDTGASAPDVPSLLYVHRCSQVVVRTSNSSFRYLLYPTNTDQCHPNFPSSSGRLLNWGICSAWYQSSQRVTNESPATFIK